jgi:replicative DNA helicase
MFQERLTELAELLEGVWFRREMVSAAWGLVQRGQLETDPQLCRIEVEHAIERLSETQEFAPVLPAQSMREVARLAVEQQRALIGRTGGTAIPTGFQRLDDELNGGIARGDYCVVVARPSHGKSAFACNVARNVTLELPDRYRVVYVHYEMTGKQLIDRIIAAQRRLSHRNMSRLNTLVELEGWESLAEQVSTDRLELMGNRAMTIDAVCSTIRDRMQRGDHVDLLIVDYLQLVPTGNHRQTEYERVTYVSQQLQRLAAECSVAVLALAQAKREAGSTNAPRLEHIKNSGAIEQDADDVLSLYNTTRAERENNAEGGPTVGPPIIEVTIEKNRHGRAFLTVPLTWYAHEQRLDDVYEELQVNDGDDF